jgi:hypothetical protein
VCLRNDLADGDIDIGFNGPSILSYQNGMVGWGNLRRKFENLGLALGFIN